MKIQALILVFSFIATMAAAQKGQPVRTVTSPVAQKGQPVRTVTSPVAQKGQPVRTVTSRNICSNSKLPRENGKQFIGGACSLTEQGEIPNIDKMVSSLIIEPSGGAKIRANRAFTVKFKVINLETGKFSDPNTEYYIKPQELNSDGLIIGHSHITIQKLSGNRVPEAKTFAFFKGLDDPADKDGVLAVQVPKGLPKGLYRICTLGSSFTHQPVIMPVAKRGPQDDCIRITAN